MTAERVHPSESLEAFAALSAEIDHPFADRAALLGSFALTEQAFAALQQTWGTRLSRDVEGLGERFVEAYSSARREAPPAQAPSEPAASPPVQPAQLISEQAISTIDVPEPAKVVVPSFMQPSEPAKAPVPAASRLSGFGETGPVDVSEVLKPSVPFDPSAPSKMSVPTVQAGLPPKSPSSRGAETVEIDISVLLRGRAAVPTPIDKPPHPNTAGAPAPASSPGAQAPARRLVRFDPQTGTPLAAPYWQDIPGSQEKK